MNLRLAVVQERILGEISRINWLRSIPYLYHMQVPGDELG
jgi:hypothetical protein